MKAVTHVNGAIESAAMNSLEINYEKAATEAIAKVKQDLAAKEIEQRLKLEIERQNFNEALTGSNPTPEAVTGSTKTGNCNTVKMVTGKPFGISKIGARIMSIIPVGGHEVTRNLSEPSDQTIMHIDVYADYLSCISPQTTSRALRALLTRGGSKSVRVDNRYRDKICILRRLQKIKGSSGLIKSLKSETDDGLSSCSNFPERPTLDEMQNEKPVLPEIEHLRGKLKDEQLEAIKDVLERNEEVFSRHKADIGCCNFVEHEIELEENAVPHREGARRKTPHKSDVCRKEIETLLEYDMIEPSKSP